MSDTILRAGLDGSGYEAGARVVTKANLDIENSTARAGASINRFESGFNKVGASSRSGCGAAKQALDDLYGPSFKFREMLHSIESRIIRIGATVLTFRLIGAAIGAVTGAAQEALRYLSLIETTGLGIASSFLVVGKYTDKLTGSTLGTHSAFLAAQRDSKEAIDMLRVANMNTIATLDQLIVAYQVALPVAMRKGLDKKQVVDFTTAVMQMAGAIGQPFDQMSEEIRSLLGSSPITKNSRMAQVLGLRPADIAQFKEDGQGLYAFLMDKMKPFQIAGAESQKTFQGLLSNLKDIGKVGLGHAFDGVFTGLKTEMLGIQNQFVVFDNQAKTATWNQVWVDKAKEVGLALGSLFSSIASGTTFLIKHAEGIWDITKLLVGYKVAMTAFNLLQAASNIVVWESGASITAKNLAMLSLGVTEQKSLTTQQLKIAALQEEFMAESVSRTAKLASAEASAIKNKADIADQMAIIDKNQAILESVVVDRYKIESEQARMAATLSGARASEMAATEEVAAAKSRLASATALYEQTYMMNANRALNAEVIQIEVIAMQELTTAENNHAAAQANLISKDLYLKELQAAKIALNEAEAAALAAQTAAKIEAVNIDNAAVAAAQRHNAALLALGNTTNLTTAAQLRKVQTDFLSLGAETQVVGSKAHVLAVTQAYNQALAIQEARLYANSFAARAMTTALSALNSVYSLLGGWLGIISAALIAGMYLWDKYGNAAEKAKEKAGAKRKETDDITKGLQEDLRQIKAKEELDRKMEAAKKGGPPVSEMDEKAVILGSDTEKYYTHLGNVIKAQMEVKDLQREVSNIEGMKKSGDSDYAAFAGQLDAKKKMIRETIVLAKEEEKTANNLYEAKKALYEKTKNVSHVPDPTKPDQKELDKQARERERLQRENDRIDNYNKAQDRKYLEDTRRLKDAEGKQELDRIKEQSEAEITLYTTKYNLFQMSQKEYEQKVYESQARVATAEINKAKEHLANVREHMAGVKAEVDKSDALPNRTNIQLEERNKASDDYRNDLIKETEAQTALNNAVAKEADLRNKNTGRDKILDYNEEIAISQAKANLLAAKGGDLASQAIKDATDLLTIHNETVRSLQEQINKENQINALRELRNENKTTAASLVGRNDQGEFNTPGDERNNALAIELEADRQILESIQRKIDAERLLQVEKETTVEQYKESILRQTELEKKADLERQISAQKTAKIKADYDKSMWTTTLNQAKKTIPQLSALDGFLAIQFKSYEKDKEDSTKLSTNGQMQMIADYTGAAGQAFSDLANQQDQSSRKGFETAKAFSIGAAIMSTASAVIAQISNPADGWTPVAWARAAIAGVLGAVQVAKIASTSYGGGGSVSSSIPSGSFGSSGGATSSVGGGIGSRLTSQKDSLSQEQLRSIADSMENASLAIGRVADGLTKIANLFTEGSFMSMIGSALATEKVGNGGSGNMFKSFFDQTSGITMKNDFNALLRFDFSRVKDMAVSAALNTIMPGLGGFASSIFGGKKSVEGQGVALGLGSGGTATARSFVDIKKKGGWFSSDKHYTEYGGASEVQGTIQSAIDSIKATINRSVVAMSTSIDMTLVQLGETKIATAGRKAEDINKDVQAWLEKAANEMAKNVVGLKDFAFYGENAFDAIVRLSTALQSTNEQFELIGAILIKSTLSGANSAWKLQDMMGGASKFNDSLDKYFTSMFTDNEQKALKSAQAQRQINVAFRELGVAVPKTRADFRSLVNGLDVTTDAGARTFAALMDISEAFGLVTNKATEAAKNMVDKTIDIMSNAASALKDIMTGPLSTKSPEELYKEQQVLFSAALATGRAAELPELGKSLLEASRAYNASSYGYIKDYDTVINALGKVAGIDGTPTMTSVERQLQLISDMKDGVEERLDRVVEKLASLEASLVSIDTTTRLVANS